MGAHLDVARGVFRLISVLVLTVALLSAVITTGTTATASADPCMDGSCSPALAFPTAVEHFERHNAKFFQPYADPPAYTRGAQSILDDVAAECVKLGDGKAKHWSGPRDGTGGIVITGPGVNGVDEIKTFFPGTYREWQNLV